MRIYREKNKKFNDLKKARALTPVLKSVEAPLYRLRARGVSRSEYLVFIRIRPRHLLLKLASPPRIRVAVPAVSAHQHQPLIATAGVYERAAWPRGGAAKRGTQ